MNYQGDLGVKPSRAAICDYRCDDLAERAAREGITNSELQGQLRVLDEKIYLLRRRGHCEIGQLLDVQLMGNRWLDMIDQEKNGGWYHEGRGWMGPRWSVLMHEIITTRGRWPQPLVEKNNRETGLAGQFVEIAAPELGTLCLMGLEPGAETHGGLLLRPLQFSRGKLAAVKDGETWQDPALARLLELGYDLENLPIKRIMAGGDTGVQQSTVAYSQLLIADLQQAETLAEELGGAWFSDQELALLATFGPDLANNHLLALIAMKMAENYLNI